MKIINQLKKYAVGLFYGMKAADKEFFSQEGGSSEVGTTINENIHQDKLSNSLRQGEVTQEVEELRYRTYEVAKKSGEFSYLGNGVAVKKEKPSTSKIAVDETDGYPLQLIQSNTLLVKNVLDEINRVDTYGDEDKYTIKCIRNFMPRFKIEDFTNKLVVKRVDVDEVQLHFYCSKYSNEYELLKTKGFINEINKIINDNTKSDILDIDSIWFVSYKAFGSDDFHRFEYNNIKFNNITEFDGNYVIKFNANIVKDGEDLTEQYYSETMAKKYENNEKKELSLDLTMHNEKYYCGKCGKEMNMYDSHISEETFGKAYCQECMLDILDDLIEHPEKIIKKK